MSSQLSATSSLASAMSGEVRGWKRTPASQAHGRSVIPSGPGESADREYLENSCRFNNSPLSPQISQYLQTQGLEIADKVTRLGLGVGVRELASFTLTGQRGWAMVPAPASLADDAGWGGLPCGAGRPTMAMITDASLALETEVEGVAFAREVLRIEAEALGAGARAAGAGDRPGGGPHLSLRRQRDRHRDGQGGAGRPEAGGDAGLDGHPGLPAAPGRGGPRRPGADPGGRRGDRAVAERRDRGGLAAGPGIAAAERPPDRDHRARDQLAGPGGRSLHRAGADRGGLSAGSGPLGQHDGADGRGRCAGPAGQPDARLLARGFRPLPSRPAAWAGS